MPWSALLITLALVFYSLGVWAERIVRYLKPWHVIAFWTGFGFDVAGTLAMSAFVFAGSAQFVIDRIGEFRDAGIAEIMFGGIRSGDVERLQTFEAQVVRAFR